MTEEDALWDEYLKGQKYQIAEQDGKFGLNFENSILLEPGYSCVEITNQNILLPDPRIRLYGLNEEEINIAVLGLFDLLVIIVTGSRLLLQSPTATVARNSPHR